MLSLIYIPCLNPTHSPFPNYTSTPRSSLTTSASLILGGAAGPSSTGASLCSAALWQGSFRESLGSAFKARDLAAEPPAFANICFYSLFFFSGPILQCWK